MSTARSLPLRLADFAASVGTDVRIGLRRLLKEKSFCAIAIGILALGIGAVTTQFAVVNGILLRGFAFPDADRLVTVEFAESWATNDPTLNPTLTAPDFVDLAAQQTSFDGVAAWLWLTAANVNLNGVTERRTAGYITHDFFRTLGVAPALGRDFTADDDRDGIAPTVILGDALWRDQFGADPNVIGRALRVNGRVGTIIGVMPRGFAFPYDEQLWLALRPEHPVRPRQEHASRAVSIYARLKPGVTLEQASAEVALIAERLARQHPENAQLKLGRVRPLRTLFTTPQTAALLYTLLAFSAGVLLIACVNVANLQFARSALRLRELAIRASFGATRARLLRQLLTENLLLALGGAALGTLFAVWAVDWLDGAVRGFRPPLPSWMTFTIDGPVLGLVLAATLIATVGSGLLPGWMAARVGLAAELKEGGRGTTARSAGVLSRGLVVFQIVVTCILLIGSLLQLRSILHQRHLDHGYDPASVLSARYILMPGEYPTHASRLAFHESLLRELRAHPALESAAFSERYRMISVDDGPIEIEGQPVAIDGPRPLAAAERVTDGYFTTLGQRLLAGRDFTAEDNDLKQPVAIVNATFARQHFANGDAVGRRFRPANPNPKISEPWRLIVGVVSDVRMSGPFASRTQNSGFYLPFSSSVYGQAKPSLNGMPTVTIIVRPRGAIHPDASLSAIRETMAKLDPDVSLFYIGTPQAQFETYLGQARLISLLSLAVGAIAVLLASAGLYGVTAHAVNRRQQEFGIRLALGADQRQLFTLVLRQAGWQIGLGLIIGLTLTVTIAVLGRTLIAQSLFETSALDPLTYAAVAVLLSVVAFVATLVPARRATRVDPISALRAE